MRHIDQGIAGDAGSQAGGTDGVPSKPRHWQPQAALCRVGQWLREQDYHFICPTPETQARVNRRGHNAEAHTLRDVFGWSRPFRPKLLPDPILDLLSAAGWLEQAGALLRSRVRYACLEGRLFAHSAHPTTARDAVFFGPDTHRFASLVRRVLQAPRATAVHRMADLGCGSGAGAIIAAATLDSGPPGRVTMIDINPRALDFAASNAAINELHSFECIQGSGLELLDGMYDLIISNPPYLIDREQRLYCHGGGAWGTEVATRFVAGALRHLAPGGRLILYTGTPVINGQDAFRLASLPLLDAARVRYYYEELDPDVFGEELERPEYAAADRIAAVGLVACRPGLGPAP